jgi:hypothetical protein
LFLTLLVYLYVQSFMEKIPIGFESSCLKCNLATNVFELKMHCNWQLNCLYVEFHDNGWANFYIILTHIDQGLMQKFDTPTHNFYIILTYIDRGLMQNFDTPTHYFNGFPAILVGVQSTCRPTPPSFNWRFSRNLQLLVPHSLYPQGLERKI